MRAFTVLAPGSGAVTERPTPRPSRAEVLVQPSHVGICGTDKHIFDGHFRTTYPHIPGHEFAGTVAAVGPDVADWHEGDRVTADPTLACGACRQCLRRRANHCERWAAIGDTVDGALAEYVVVPARNLFRVEDHEDLAEAAFTEPLACVVWGIERLRVAPADRAIVFGTGPVGCLMAQMLCMSPAADVVVVDVAAEKLNVARQLGARATYLAGPELANELLERTEGRKFDVVVDCTGQPAVITGLFEHAAPHARIMLFGVAPPGASIPIDPYEVYRNDWEILGSMAINQTMQQARDLIASGRVRVRPLLTRLIGLDDVAGVLSNPKGPDELKVMVQPARVTAP